MKRLTELVKGERGFVVDLQDNRYCEELFELGFFPGDLITVKENDSTKDSIVIEIHNVRFPLFRRVASTIITNIVSFEISLN